MSLDLTPTTPLEVGLTGALRLKDIDHARARLDFWRERHELAQSKIVSWQKELRRREAISRGDPVPSEHHEGIY